VGAQGARPRVGRVSPPGQRERPGVDGSQALSEVTSTVNIVPQCADRPRFDLPRIHDRRHASLELDRLLGVCRYPDPHELYGMTAALARMLEAEAVA
jgi:hypothetical protein